MAGLAVDVDLGNPGQLLACCGLLEAADRLWRGEALITGCFEDSRFRVEAPGGLAALLKWLGEAHVKDVEVKPAGKRSNCAEYAYAGPGGDACNLSWPDGASWRLNSWSGEDFGRTRIKTFAGQMKGPTVVAYLLDDLRRLDPAEARLFDAASTEAGASLFGFDARKGRPALDVGFSQDALGISGEEFPAVELFATLGLQGFRPQQVRTRLQADRSRRGGPQQVRTHLRLGVWTQPLPVELARAAAGCAFEPPGLRRFQFRLLGRKERGGVTGAPNDQYKAFTRAVEVFDPGEEDSDE